MFEFIKAFFYSMFSVISHSPLWWVCIILGILATVFYPKFRGYMGEFWVKQELKKLPKDKYLVLNDIMLKINDKTYQIDHIVISQFGIFVIEMKNYYGTIYGDEYKNEWLGYLRRKKFYFHNPIHQNYGHVLALKELLNIDESLFIPIVCFSNQARLKVKCKNVTYLDYLTKVIISYQESILNYDINKIYEYILKNNITDKKIRKEHVQSIKHKIGLNNEKVTNMICPKCGGKLIVRNGKYGNFIGCSNYPKCRFTKNIE